MYITLIESISHEFFENILISNLYIEISDCIIKIKKKVY